VVAGHLSFSGRARQAWTIAKVELRRAFFAKRALWVYGLALLPALIFRSIVEQRSNRFIFCPAVFQHQTGDCHQVGDIRCPASFPNLVSVKAAGV